MTIAKLLAKLQLLDISTAKYRVVIRDDHEERLEVIDIEVDEDNETINLEVVDVR